MSQLTGPTQVAGQPLFSTSSVQQHVLGEKMVSPDGRSFRYCKAGGTTLVPGKLQSASAEDTALQAIACAVSAVGATTVTTTATVTLTANQLSGGYLTFESATTGAGLTYRIKSHPAASAAVVTLTLEDPIITATTGTVLADMIPSPYDGVVVNASTAVTCPIGVAIYPITNAQYGWLQTSGPVSVLMDGTGVVGTAQAASNATAGAVEPLTGVQASVGTLITGVATTDYGMIMLNLE